MQTKQYRFSIDYLKELQEVRDDILATTEHMVGYAVEQGGESFGWEIAKIFVQNTLFPELAREKVSGKFKWFKPKEGYGFVQSDSGEDAFFVEAEVLDSAQAIAEGVRVEYDVVQGEQGPIACNIGLRKGFAPEGPAERTKGKVKWVDKKKGYGFVTSDMGVDAFVVEMEALDSFSALREGLRVEYDVVQGEKGPIAQNVRIVHGR